MRPRLLDLFCGAGGAAMGYYRAGFDVVGVDIKPQPRYPFEFHQADAMTYPLDGFDVIHASPPCQRWTSMRKGRWSNRVHPDLLGPTRCRLEGSGVPWVIENVIGSPLRASFVLCGTMFGLETAAGSQLRRHRLFESPACDLALLPPCQHNAFSAIGVYGGGQHPQRRYGQPWRAARIPQSALFGVSARGEAMGIDWMTGAELSQAIPPAYTEWIGKQLLEVLAQCT